MTYIVSFYIIGVPGELRRGTGARARTLLAEKETAFDQLDLLHRSIIESVDAGIMTMNLQQQVKSFNGRPRRSRDSTPGRGEPEQSTRCSQAFPAPRPHGPPGLQRGCAQPLRDAFLGKDGEEMVLGYAVSALKTRETGESAISLSSRT